MEARTYTLEEQKANRKLWVEALRSGKYEQVPDTLCASGGYCCLGVAGNLLGLSDVDLAKHDNLGGLPDVMSAFGLSDSDGGFEGNSSTGLGSLAELNDDGKSFAEIADIIESEPPGLFVAASDV